MAAHCDTAFSHCDFVHHRKISNFSPFPLPTHTDYQTKDEQFRSRSKIFTTRESKRASLQFAANLRALTGMWVVESRWVIE